MIELSPRNISWILFNLPMLREEYHRTELSSTLCYFPITWARTETQDYRIERVAIRKATVEAILTTMDKVFEDFHPEHRKIYRMRFKAGLKYWQIQKRTFLSKKSVERKLTQIKNQATLALLGLPDSYLEEIRRVLGE